RQVVDLVETSRAKLAAAAPADIEAVRALSEPLIAFSAEMQAWNQELKRFLRENLYRHYKVHRMSVKARQVIHSLFAAFLNDLRLLPPEPYRNVRELEEIEGEAGR